MKRIAALLLPALLALPALETVRGLRDEARRAWALRGETDEVRRRVVLGSWHAVVEEVRGRVPESGAIDFVMVTPEGRDVAVFAGAALAPRDCRYFDGWDDWRARRRAVFFHDDRAANAAPGPAPGEADLVVVVDGRIDPPLRIAP